MIFSALLESATAAVHAANERAAALWQRRRGRTMASGGRLGMAAVLLVDSIFIAERFGLVALIAQGYRGLAYLFLAVYVLPLLTVGAWRLWRHATRASATLPPHQ